MHHHLHFSAISSCAYSEREPVGISSNAFYGVECLMFFVLLNKALKEIKRIHPSLSSSFLLLSSYL